MQCEEDQNIRYSFQKLLDFFMLGQVRLGCQVGTVNLFCWEPNANETFITLITIQFLFITFYYTAITINITHTH